MVDAAGTTKFTYNANGQLLTEDGPWSSDTVTYSYNTGRLRSGLGLQQPTGTWTNGLTYDSARRLSTVIFSGGTFTYTYQTPGSLVKKIALPNTSYITNTFDSVARLTSTLLNSSSHTTLDKMDYLYNAGNRRIKATRADASYYTNVYDNIGQLRIADSTVASEDRNYGYDAAWNLNKRTNNTTVYTFTVDGKNQLKAAYTDNYYTSAGSRWKVEFTYDGRGRLRKRIDYTWLDPYGWYGGVETRYVYDGMRVIQERNSGNTPTVGYTRGSDLSGSFEGAGGIGGLLERSHGYSSGTFSTHSYYHADGNGNITYLVNSSQSVVASYRYDPFGNTISSSGSLASANVYRFSSKEIHVNSAMYYYGYRWYDPNLQRWPNRDPVGELGGSNLYGFLFNDPADRIDAFGLAPPWLPPLPKWPFPSIPTPPPWPLPNWPGATLGDRLSVCLNNCLWAYNRRRQDCLNMYGPGTCPFTNPIAVWWDTHFSGPVELAMCMSVANGLLGACMDNCYLKLQSPWN